MLTDVYIYFATACVVLVLFVLLRKQWWLLIASYTLHLVATHIVNFIDNATTLSNGLDIAGMVLIIIVLIRLKSDTNRK